MSSETKPGASASVLKSRSGSDVPDPEATTTAADVAKLKRHINTESEAKHRHKRQRAIRDQGSGLANQPAALQQLPVQSVFQEGLGGGEHAGVKAGADPSGDGAARPRAGVGCAATVKHVRFAEHLQGQDPKSHYLGVSAAQGNVQHSVFTITQSVHAQVATQSPGDGSSMAPGGRSVAPANATNGDSEPGGAAAGAAGGQNARLARLLLAALSAQRHQASGAGSGAVGVTAAGTTPASAAGPATGHPAGDTTSAPDGLLHFNGSSGATPCVGLGAAGAAGGQNARLARLLLAALSAQRHQASGVGSGAVGGAAAAGTTPASAAGPATGHAAGDTTSAPDGSLHFNGSSGATPCVGLGAAGAAGGQNARLARLLLAALSAQRHQASGAGSGAVGGVAAGIARAPATKGRRRCLEAIANADAVGQFKSGAGAAVAPGMGSGRKRRKSNSAAAADADADADGQLKSGAGAAMPPGMGSGRKRRKSNSAAAADADADADGQLKSGAGAAMPPGMGSGRKRRKSNSAGAADADGVPTTEAAPARTKNPLRRMQRLSSLLWKPGADNSDRPTDSSESGAGNEGEDDDDDIDDDNDDDDHDDDNIVDDNDDYEGVAFNNAVDEDCDDSEEDGDGEGEEVNEEDLQTLVDILRKELGGTMELDWNSDGNWLHNLLSDGEGVEDDEHTDIDDSDFEQWREPKEKTTEGSARGRKGGEGESNGEAGNEDGGADADTSDSAEPTETAPKEHPPDGRCGRRRILWRVDRRTRWRRKAEEYKKRLPGGCLPGMSSGGVLMSNEELWDARLLAKSCLVAEEEPETRHKRLFRKRLPDELAPKWTQLDEAVETELKLSRAMAAGAPLPPPKHPRPHLPSVASATADGAMAGREVIAGGWHLPYDTSSTPYWSARAAPQLGPEAVRDAAAAMGGAGVKGNDNGSGSGGAGVAARRGTAQFGFRIKVHSSRLDGISVQEARARAARLYRTGSSGQMGSDRSSSICSSNGEDCSSDSSSSGEMADPDGDEGQAAAVMAAEEGDEGLGAGICLRHQRSGKAGLHASARVRKVDELLAVPDPECDDGVGPADDVRLERANTAFFDEYFWEQSRTVQKQYDYTVRDGSSTSRPSSQGLGYRQRWLFAHWELTLRCTHPGCGAEKLIHLPAAVPGRLTLEELAASGLRVWVVRPEGNRGEHNHAPPGGGGVLWRSGRPLSELHRLVPEGLQVDMPLATMLPIPLPHQQQLPAAGPSEGAANVTVAADDTRCGGIPPSFHSVPPSQRAAAAVWLLEPPSPPVWKCRGWIWKPREPGGRPQLTICGAINRAGDWAAAGNTGAAGLAGSAKTGLSGSFSGNSCGSCGSCRPDGRHGMLRQLVSAALDQHDPASVTPLQLHGHVAMATSVSGGGVPPMFSLPEVAADAFVVLMQRIARALLHHHLPPLLPQPPPPPSLLLLTPPSGDHTNVEVLNTVVKPIVDAVVKSAAWSWPGITLLHAELGASPPDVAAICAARAFGGLKARKVARKDIIEDPERFVMGDDDCLELQRAAGVLGVAGGSGGGGGSGPPPVDVEEVGDWHMPLAFRQLQRRIAETYSVSVTAKALAEEVAANAVGTQAASEMTTRAADDAARPCSHHQSTMQTQTSRISQVAEVASHAVMALLCSLEAPADLRDQQKSVWLRPEVILGDPYGSSPSGGPFADGALANQRTIFVGGGGRLAPGANGVGCDGDVGLKESRTRSERSESQNGSGFEPGPAPRLALDTAQLLQPELQKHCPQVAALVAPLAPRAEPSIGGDAAAGMLGNAGHSNAVTGGSGIATAAGDAQPAAYVARRRDALAWDDPQAVQPALELCGPAVRVHNPDVDGLRDHPMGMPYMVSVLAKRRRLNSEHVGVGVGSSDKGAYNLCRQEWFYHCLRQQLHPECESFGGPVGQQAGLQLHATGPLHWLPKAANQQAAAEAAAAAVLQTGVAATTSHEGLAVMLRSAVHGGDCHRGRGATAGDDVSTTAMATAAAAGAQLDLLSSSLVAPVPDRQLAAAAIAASVGQRTPAAAAPVITLVPPPAAIKYHANIALARGAMSPPAIRPIFHRRGIPTSTVTLVVQFSIAWASRQRAAMLPAQHVPMPKRRRKKLPGPPVHPPWALESTPMGDPWDIAGIEAVQQTGSVASCDDGQRDDANGGDNRDGSKLTQRLLRAAADAVEADSGLNTSARGAGSFPGYAWRPWVSVTERRTPGSNEDARAANVAQKGQRVEGYSSRQMPGAGKRKLKAGPQHETVAAAGAPAAASGAGSGANASGSGAAQATDECSPLPPSIVMVEELARRSIFSGRADLSARAQARFRAVVQMRGSVLQPGGARGGSGQGN